jgi:hypothetical protein
LEDVRLRGESFVPFTFTHEAVKEADVLDQVGARRGKPAGTSILLTSKVSGVESGGGRDVEVNRDDARADLVRGLLAQPRLTRGSVLDGAEKHFGTGIHHSCAEEVLTEEVAPNGRADLGGRSDECRTIGHENDGALVKERPGEDSLLCRGETDRVVHIVTDLSQGSAAHGLGAGERVGANRVFPAVSNEPSRHKPGASL